MPKDRVRDYMTADVWTVRDDDALRVVLNPLLTRRFRHVPVLGSADRLVGILTDHDLRRALPSPLVEIDAGERDQLVDETTVSRVMTKDPTTVSPDAPLEEAVGLLIDQKIGGLPVVDNGKLLGIFTETDALRAFLETIRRG